VRSEAVFETNYEIGEPQEVYVGEAMIRFRELRRDIYSSDRVTILNDFSVQGLGQQVRYRRGSTYPYGGVTQVNGAEFDFFIDNGRGMIFNATGQLQDIALIGVPRYAPRFSDPIIVPNGDGFVGREEVEDDQIEPDGANYEIVYSGLDGDTLRMTYREYTEGNMARSAFFQALSYPVSSPSIRFRDLVISVDSATSESIRFNVISDGR